jgi:DNA-binding transcriptional ArsR family regulator
MEALAGLQDLLQTLAEVNRLKILNLIGSESRPVSEIVKGVRLSQPLVSHHLRVMKESGLLVSKREGPFVRYSVKDPRLLEILGVLNEMASDLGGRRRRTTVFRCPPWWDQVRRRPTGKEKRHAST